MRMENKPKLIIVEGPQGSGKTTMTNWLREQMTSTNLYRLSGHNDKSPMGQRKSSIMYDQLHIYLMVVSRAAAMNVVMDRTFISEYVYCTLGYKEYDFRTEYLQLCVSLDRLSMFYDIYIMNLYLNDPIEYKERLQRDKPQYQDAKFDIASSIRQQDAYNDAIKLLNDVKKSFSCIKTFNIDTTHLDKSRAEVFKILGLGEK